MNEKERYLFDLQGFLLVENVLSEEQLGALNRVVDKLLTEDATRWSYGLFGSGEQALYDLIDDPVIMPYMTEMLGEHYRLDHEYGIFHRKGAAQLNLHGGGTPYDPGQYYHVRNEKMYCGLTVVSYALTDIGPDDGGFCCIPGSHKSNYRMPREYLHYDEIGPTVHIPQKAGSVLIFTEALTHGTFAWQAEHERRSLLYKYSPGAIAWGRFNRSPELLERLTPAQRKILEPSYHPYLRGKDSPYAK